MVCFVFVVVLFLLVSWDFGILASDKVCFVLCDLDFIWLLGVKRWPGGKR